MRVLYAFIHAWNYDQGSRRDYADTLAAAVLAQRQRCGAFTCPLC